MTSERSSYSITSEVSVCPFVKYPNPITVSHTSVEHAVLMLYLLIQQIFVFFNYLSCLLTLSLIGAHPGYK